LGIPSLDDLKKHQTENPQQAPGLESLNPSRANEQPHSATSPAFDDDYTPVPILTKAQKEAQRRRQKEASLKREADERSRFTENTLTDHSQPVLIPPQNLISDQEISEALDLDKAHNKKLVIAHMMGHLRRDYEKLIWVEQEKGEHYFVKFVHGDWKVTELAWKMHINLTNPNIFRIAYKSGFPFHGEVSPNPHNEKYFEWWNRGVVPNFVTIHPVTHNENVIGFLAGFGKNSEFDEVGSLKKMENLLTICKKALVKFIGHQAA
jgi:hypothetical protein